MTRRSPCLPSRVSSVRIPSPAPHTSVLIPALASNSRLHAIASLRRFDSNIDSNRMPILCRAEANHARYEHTAPNTPSANKRSERTRTPTGPGVCGIRWAGWGEVHPFNTQIAPQGISTVSTDSPWLTHTNGPVFDANTLGSDELIGTRYRPSRNQDAL